MAESLVVRVYNVHFGDAILVTVPDRNTSTGKVTVRRILIDVGNAPRVVDAGGGDDAVFKSVVEDILNQLDGRPLDLYVMTHEHLDHVQGLPHAAWKLYPNDFLQRFKVRHVWLTASSAPNYYENHPNAKKKKLEFDAMRQKLTRFVSMYEGADRPAFLRILAKNDSTKTSQCVEFLRTLNPDKTTYIYRGVNLNKTHPFKEAKLAVWAPEEDTADYYSSFQPLSLVNVAGSTSPSKSVPVLPPAGVDVGAFLNLVRARGNGIADNLLAIDQAANNTSIVFTLEWRGWRFLFPGDAEQRSWRTMHNLGILKPVHFLKVSHHGSHNGTPSGNVFDAILPKPPPDARPRHAASSTWRETYSGIPHKETDHRIATRCELHSTLDDENALSFDLDFPGPIVDEHNSSH
jgi:beta-lactamase superfamily II metal-dependent hydrolase